MFNDLNLFLMLAYFIYGVGKFLDISVQNRRAENCPELPGLPLCFYESMHIEFK